MKTLDLFAGAGGWDVAAHRMGWDADRVERWATANATATAAGFRTVHHDVTTFTTTPGEYVVHLGSPSCKRYSMAGNGAGRKALGQVLTGVEVYRDGGRLTHDQAVSMIGDADAALTLEPLRIALEGEPVYIAWEQTPAVLPVWEACAGVLRAHGYSVEVGNLNAEQYGVPQTRRRAVLMARRDGKNTQLPTPTHSRYWNRDPKRLDAGVKPWVSMAEALGWTVEEDLGKSFTAATSAFDRVVLRERPGREVDQPGFTIRASAGGMEPGGFRWSYRAGAAAHSSVRPLDTPSPVMAFGHNSARHQWVKGGVGKRISDREAGYEATFKVTAEQAASFQTFPAGFPFQGNKGEVFQQIGNAVPPLLAESILSALVA